MDAILNIYETMAIFLLFNDHQDTEYDSCELICMEQYQFS